MVKYRKVKIITNYARIVQELDEEISTDGGSLRYLLAKKYNIVEGTRAFKELMSLPEMIALKEKHKLTTKLKSRTTRSFC